MVYRGVLVNPGSILFFLFFARASKNNHHFVTFCHFAHNPGPGRPESPLYSSSSIFFFPRFLEFLPRYKPRINSAGRLSVPVHNALFTFIF